MNKSEVVVCAAIRLSDGLVVCGARHFDKIMREQMSALPENVTIDDAVEGFINQYGHFLTRTQAHDIAKVAGQIKHRCGGDEHTLYSENLY